MSDQSTEENTEVVERPKVYILPIDRRVQTYTIKGKSKCMTLEKGDKDIEEDDLVSNEKESAKAVDTTNEEDIYKMFGRGIYEEDSVNDDDIEEAEIPLDELLNFE